MHAADVSADLTRTVLGADAFYRASRGGSADQLDREGLVPVHWSALEPVRFGAWDDAIGRLDRVAERASRLPDPYQRDWLTEQALAVKNLLRWLSGAEMTYEEVVAGTLRVDPRPPTPAQLRALRAKRDAAIEEAGYASFRAYRADHLVPAGQVDEHARALVAEARERTERRLPHLRLPQDVIGVKVVTGTAFSAYCDYPGRAVWINADVPLTFGELKHLIAHESYPGHDAHMGHRDAMVRSGDMLDDAALVITNTASSVLFEGIAERGLDLLGWRDDVHDQIAWLHERLQWLASIEAAHALNTGRSTPAEIARFLRETCDGEEAWIDAKLRFVTHALRAPFVYGYWWGGTVVGAWLRRVPALAFGAAVRHLYDRMHSPTTLAAHWHEEGDQHAN